MDPCEVVVEGEIAQKLYPVRDRALKIINICSVRHNGEAGYNFGFVNTLYLVLLKLAACHPNVQQITIGVEILLYAHPNKMMR